MRHLPWTRLGAHALAGLFLASLLTCAEGGGGSGAAVATEPGILQVWLTDAPADLESLWVTVDDLGVHRSGGPWESVPLISGDVDSNGDGIDDVIANPDGSVTVDLIALQGIETLFGAGVVGSGHYTQIRLRVVSAEAVEGGVGIPLKVPSGAQTGLKIVGQFTVGPREVVNLYLDFDAEESVVYRGESGSPPILEPVIRVVPGCLGPSGTFAYFGETFPIPSCSVVYVLDRSGSMSYQFGPYVDRFGNTVTTTRWDFVTDRTISSFQALPETARFNVITYACNRDKFRVSTVLATPSNKATAEVWLLGHFPWGGTGTGPAGVEALLEKDNRTVLLVSNGQPNCGATGTTGHLNMILAENTQGAAIHTFGIDPYGVFQFLRDLAAATGGIYLHLEP